MGNLMTFPNTERETMTTDFRKGAMIPDSRAILTIAESRTGHLAVTDLVIAAGNLIAKNT